MNRGVLEIILIEDNPNDAELISRSLKKCRLANDILHLKDGAEALDFFLGPHAAESHAPRVVLLDLQLPKIDGMEVLRRMKHDSRTRDVPVVILTSSRDHMDVKEINELGIYSFVTKPVRFDEFAMVVARLGISWLMVHEPLVRTSSGQPGKDG